MGSSAPDPSVVATAVAETLEALADAAAGGRVQRFGRVTAIVTGIPIPTLNGVWATDPPGGAATAAGSPARAVNDGLAAGASWSWLQSSTAGLGVYARLGFRTLERWSCWVSL